MPELFINSSIFLTFFLRHARRIGYYLDFSQLFVLCSEHFFLLHRQLFWPILLLLYPSLVAWHFQKTRIIYIIINFLSFAFLTFSCGFTRFLSKASTNNRDVGQHQKSGEIFFGKNRTQFGSRPWS